MKEINKTRAEKIKEYKKLYNVPEFINPDEYHLWLETPEGKAYVKALEAIREEVKGRGGLRAGAGRKKLYPESVPLNKRISKDSVIIMKEFAKEKKISEAEALDRLLKCAGKHLQEA
jgi:hypothetical protein